MSDTEQGVIVSALQGAIIESFDEHGDVPQFIPLVEDAYRALCEEMGAEEGDIIEEFKIVLEGQEYRIPILIAEVNE